MALYPHHSADEIAAFTKPQRAAYEAQRGAFAREVADLVATARRQGWIDVGTAGRVVRFNLPVVLERGGRAIHRGTIGLGLRGQP
jgi:hypothetical protein